MKSKAGQGLYQILVGGLGLRDRAEVGLGKGTGLHKLGV